MRHWAYMFAIAMAVAAPANLAWAGDRQVAEQIAGKLQASGKLRGYNVRVKFEDGTVSLRGRVATRQQVSAALAVAQQTKGVEKVVNGLIVRAEPHRESRMAPIAPRQPVDHAVAQARLVPRSSPTAPVPRGQADPRPFFSAAKPSPTPEAGDQQVASGDATLSIKVPDAALAFPEPGAPAGLLAGRRPAESLRSLEFATTSETLPKTVQKASFSASTGLVHVSGLHLATRRTSFAEPLMLPDESGSSSGEVFVSDEPDLVPALLAGGGAKDAIPSAESTARSKLTQPLLHPVRRSWTGGHHESSPTMMRASLGGAR